MSRIRADAAEQSGMRAIPNDMTPVVDLTRDKGTSLFEADARFTSTSCRSATRNDLRPQGYEQPSTPRVVRLLTRRLVLPVIQARPTLPSLIELDAFEPDVLGIPITR